MIRKISILTIAIAGLFHLMLAPQHYSHAPAHGIFFAFIGIVEISWAITFWLRPSSWSYYVGIALAGGLIVLWAITRFAPSPFEHEPGSIDAWGILCKISELMGFAALINLTIQGKIAGITRLSTQRAIMVALALALISGVAFYGLGFAAEPLFPTLGSREHDHEENGVGQHEEVDMEAEHEAGGEHSSPSEQVGLSNDLRIENAWGRPAISGQNSAVYFTIQNLNERDDRLLSVSTDIAESAGIHLTVIDTNGIASMSPQESVDVLAHGIVEFKPGGLHVMLLSLTRDLKAGDTFWITLSFQEAGDVVIEVNVKDL